MDINDELDDLLGENASEQTKVAPTKGKVKEAKPKGEVYRTIIIDEADNQPNYEVVGVNGKIYQIQRGVETRVPESVVEVLRNAVASKYIKVRRADGVDDIQKRNLSSIPWRLVG